MGAATIWVMLAAGIVLASLVTSRCGRHELDERREEHAAAGSAVRTIRQDVGTRHVA